MARSRGRVLRGLLLARNHERRPLEPLLAEELRVGVLRHGTPDLFVREGVHPVPIRARFPGFEATDGLLKRHSDDTVFAHFDWRVAEEMIRVVPERRV